MIWIRSLLTELGHKLNGASKLLCDNSAVVILSDDQVFHDSMKYFDVRYHWIRECVENGEIGVTQIATSDNVVPCCV